VTCIVRDPGTREQGDDDGVMQSSNRRGRMGNAVMRCTFKLDAVMRSMRKRGDWECGVLQQLYCFNLSVWCDSG